MAEPDTVPEKQPFWKRHLIWGMPLAGVAGAFAAGIIFWGGFNTAMEATNTESFCISCHEMREFVYEEYKGTIHTTIKLMNFINIVVIWINKIPATSDQHF